MATGTRKTTIKAKARTATTHALVPWTKFEGAFVVKGSKLYINMNKLKIGKLT